MYINSYSSIQKHPIIQEKIKSILEKILYQRGYMKDLLAYKIVLKKFSHLENEK